MPHCKILLGVAQLLCRESQQVKRPRFLSSVTLDAATGPWALNPGGHRGCIQPASLPPHIAHWASLGSRYRTLATWEHVSAPEQLLLTLLVYTLGASGTAKWVAPQWSA
eukprot:EG_transcript_20271